MIYLPELNPSTFLFFFERGATGFSYSLRDYSLPHRVTERYACDLGYSAVEIRRRATHSYDAPFMDVKRLADWHAYTVALNSEHGLNQSSGREQGLAPALQLSTAEPRFPVLNCEVLNSLPKAAKTGDVRRIFDSPQSEDWVTWNMMHLLKRARPSGWWTELLARAQAENPNVTSTLMSVEPKPRFWSLVVSPKQYEAASRERMRNSYDSLLAARSRDPEPVEGSSEIDITFDSDKYLVYVEAKLGSDISFRTTYDPERNQIVRNIDCLVEAAGARRPIFWMFVRDKSASLAYMQLVREYQMNPKTLCRTLPHRDPAKLEQVARDLTVLTWREIGLDVCSPNNSDDNTMLFIKGELRRRIAQGTI